MYRSMSYVGLWGVMVWNQLKTKNQILLRAASPWDGRSSSRADGRLIREWWYGRDRSEWGKWDRPQLPSKVPLKRGIAGTCSCKVVKLSPHSLEKWCMWKGLGWLHFGAIFTKRKWLDMWYDILHVSHVFTIREVSITHVRANVRSTMDSRWALLTEKLVQDREWMEDVTGVSGWTCRFEWPKRRPFESSFGPDHRQRQDWNRWSPRNPQCTSFTCGNLGQPLCWHSSCNWHKDLTPLRSYHLFIQLSSEMIYPLAWKKHAHSYMFFTVVIMVDLVLIYTACTSSLKV